MALFLLPQPPAEVVSAKQATRRVPEIVSRLARASGLLALADSSVQGLEVPLPEIPDSLDEAGMEKALEALVKQMPDGSTWVKLWLPPPPKGSRWTGDQLMTYLQSLASLYGRVGAQADGQSEILARPLPDEQAKAVKTALSLQPVYLVTARGARTFVGQWQSTFGVLTMTVRGNRVDGTYTSNGGVLRGTIRNGRLFFDWFENGGSSSGTGFFDLSADGRSFSGRWGSGAESPEREWVGTRVVSGGS